MASAGMLTYGLPQTLHRLADCESRLRCVCLCRERLDEVAYRLPHSEHVYLDGRPGDVATKSAPTVATAAPLTALTPELLPAPVPHADLSPHSSPDVAAAATAAADDLRFDRPSLTKNASYVYATVLLVVAGGVTGIGRCCCCCCCCCSATLGSCDVVTTCADRVTCG